ncbi:MAG: undecaprenyl-diphosphate phosphatase [Sulfolobales archaeon]
MDLFYILLGILQGFVEWLPISSKTVLLLFSSYVLGYSLASSYTLSLALQAGTVASALSYFWRNVVRVFRERWLLRFLIISTIATGVVGVPLYMISERILRGSFELEIPTMIIGLILVIQAFISMKTRSWMGRSEKYKDPRSIGFRESLLFGVVQGIAALPGVSRSGATVTALLLLGYSLEDSMRLSFIASIVANSGALATVYLFSEGSQVLHDIQSIIAAFLVSAVVGFLTIGALLRLAARYRSYMTLAMGLITIAIALIISLHRFL